MKFMVWDVLNGELEFADEIEAVSADDAALRYAEEDADGSIDGLYTGREDHPIDVPCPDGTIEHFSVRAEMQLRFYASRRKTDDNV